MSNWPDISEPVGGWPANQSEPWDEDAAPDVYPDENLLPVKKANVPELNGGEDDFKNPVVGV